MNDKHKELLDRLDEIKSIITDPTTLLNHQEDKTRLVDINTVDADEITKKAQRILDSIEVVYPPTDLKEESLKAAIDYAVKFGIEVGIIHTSIVSGA